MAEPRRIAMWSGPRNLSTAMMYSFAQRADCSVSDEPFYGAYLKATGIDHPMAAETMASEETDPARVSSACRGPVPGGKTLWYQKHMAHHMIAGMPLDWIGDVTNVFLIRHPARVVASYARKRENPVAADLGFHEQVTLVERVRALGQQVIVIDSADILEGPDRALSALCGAIGIAFDPAMLTWPSGGRPEDGVWAKVWYRAVHRSTGFGPPEGSPPDLEGAYAALAEALMPSYAALSELKLSF